MQPIPLGAAASRATQRHNHRNAHRGLTQKLCQTQADDECADFKALLPVERVWSMMSLLNLSQLEQKWSAARAPLLIRAATASFALSGRNRPVKGAAGCEPAREWRLRFRKQHAAGADLGGK